MGQTLVVGVVGLGILAIGLLQVMKSRRAGSWSEAPGTIFGASVQQDTPSDPETASLYVKVEYRFLVAGREYSGSRIRFDDRRFTSRKQVDAELAKYAAGRQVRVYYNPVNPGECVLERANTTGWALLGVGGLMVVLALAALLK